MPFPINLRRCRRSLGGWLWLGLLATKTAAEIVPNDPRLPSLTPTPPYVASQTCQECHPKEHASWHQSFHRTMTQVAFPDVVRGKFDGTTVQSDGLSYRVFREGNELAAEMPDPDLMMYVVQGGMKLAPSQIPRVQVPVVLATGSHHYQTYWVASKRYPGLLQTLPLVYLLADERWVPREAAFLRGPSDQGRIITQWNHHCIRCHSTAGNPGLDEATGLLKSRVAELGIACEACHGPGEAHVLKQKSLRHAPEQKRGRDESIVNPSLLDHKRSSQVCGQCHGVYITKDEFAMRFAKEGPLYRPGDDIHETRYYPQHPGTNPTPENRAHLKRNLDFFRERWWDDGSILAGGREYTALLATGCFTRGELSCVSCHSMHRSDPADQLKANHDGPKACTECHNGEKFTTNLRDHTRHSPESDGSNCLNCHMPHTTYALFKAIRSHQISSPRVEPSVRFGTPNACNLCHLDKTLAWTQEHLAAWKPGKGRPFPLSNEDQTLSAAVSWLLKGNAAQRVIAAWHLGWKPAQNASGTDWLAPFAGQLLQDPYGVVRYVAARSLRSIPGFTDIKFDFLGSEEELKRSTETVLQRWTASGGATAHPNANILIGNDGKLITDRVRELLSKRNDRSVTIKE